MSGYDDELKPDAEANRIISDPDLINIDIKELNKMLKERGISKVDILQNYNLFEYLTTLTRIWPLDLSREGGH